MNKDFFTKSISLEDIKKLDIRKIKNKKEIVIGILILAYIITIFCIGNSLLKSRQEVKAQYDIKEQRYNSLQNAPSEEELKEQIQELSLEKERLSDIVQEVDNNEFRDILSEFKRGAPISWEEEEVSLKPETKEFANYDIYIVNIKDFSITFDQLEEFLTYVENYNKVVRIDTLGIKKSEITGKMTGQLKLSFYFRKLSV